MWRWALSRMDRQRALVILMCMYVAGNLLCGLAPTYSLLLVARVLTALCHGAFFGIGSIVAANLVPKNERNQAIAMMFSGLTIANVLGVPAGTALGQAFGWRAAFFALVPIGLIAAIGLWRMVPSQPAESLQLKHEFRAVARPQVQLVLAMSTLSSVALFCVFTYIAPILESVTHLAPRHGDVGAGGVWHRDYGGEPAGRQAGRLAPDGGSHWRAYFADPHLRRDAGDGAALCAGGGNGVRVGRGALWGDLAAADEGWWNRRRVLRTWRQR